MSSEKILFSERPEWTDVTPLEQYEGVNPLVPIFYSEEYKDATSYLRGIVQTQEKSARVLDLTESIIRMNPAHYTSWQYRYETLLAIKHPLAEELELMDEMAVKFLKTYQVWHHRRLLVTQLLAQRSKEGEDVKLEILKKELGFVAQSLGVDTKNYHTWSYRQWLLAYFLGGAQPTRIEGEENKMGVWEEEKVFVESLLDGDVRNNSAWHHRFYVVFQAAPWGLKEDVVKRELAFTKQKISIAPNNASAWNYLRGMLEHTKQSYSTVKPFVEMYIVASDPESETSDVVDLENPKPSLGTSLPAVPAVEMMADILESEGGDGIGKAKELWTRLGEELDPIRKKYWEHRTRSSQSAT